MLDAVAVLDRALGNREDISERRIASRLGRWAFACIPTSFNLPRPFLGVREILKGLREGWEPLAAALRLVGDFARSGYALRERSYCLRPV